MFLSVTLGSEIIFSKRRNNFIDLPNEFVPEKKSFLFKSYNYYGENT